MAANRYLALNLYSSLHRGGLKKSLQFGTIKLGRSSEAGGSLPSLCAAARPRVALPHRAQFLNAIIPISHSPSSSRSCGRAWPARDRTRGQP